MLEPRYVGCHEGYQTYDSSRQVVSMKRFGDLRTAQIISTEDVELCTG